MKFKTLKHKELPDTYGYIEKLEDYYEILTGDTPALYPMSSTMEEMSKYWEHLHETALLEQLKDYDFIEVELLTPEELKNEGKEHAWRVFDHASTLFFAGEKRAYFEELWNKKEVTNEVQST